METIESKIKFKNDPIEEDSEEESELSIKQVQNISDDLEMTDIKDFFSYVENPNKTCNHSKIFGGSRSKYKNIPFVDGDKVVCMDAEFNISPHQCLVYSFGINNDWAFDDAMARYGCQIYSFDPTMNVKSHKRSDKISFYNIGISDKDEFVIMKKKMRELKRFTSIMALLGHQQDDVVIDYLKMDVEGAEVSFLEDVLQNSPDVLKRIKQIGMEIHVGKYTIEREDIFRINYRLFKQLESLGFRLFSSKWNPLPFNKYFLEEVGRNVNGYYELVWGLWPTSY